MNLSSLDAWIVGIFFLAVLILGFRSEGKKDKSIESYFLAGRRLTLFPFVLSFVATWYGGILGVGEFVHGFGLAAWTMQGLPYYVFALAFAMWILPRMRSVTSVTLPDLARKKYGNRHAGLTAFFLAILSSPAPYILMMAVLLGYYFGVPRFVALCLSCFLACAYVFKGGFASTIRVDRWLCFLMYAGFVLLFSVAWFRFGPVWTLPNQLPEDMTTLSGGLPFQYLMVWFFVAFWTFVDPTFYQKIFAVEKIRTARVGVVVSVLLWFCFDMLTLSTALYAKVHVKALSSPLYVYPEAARAWLPSGVNGLFAVSLFATIMSTLNTVTLVSSTSLGRDFLGSFQRQARSPWMDSSRGAKLGMLLVLPLSVFLAWVLPSVVSLWYVLASLCVPPLLWTVMTCLYPALAMPKGPQFLGQVLAFLLPLAWFAGGVWQGTLTAPHYLQDIEPMLPGLAWVGIGLGIFRLTRKLSSDGQSSTDAPA